MSRAPEMARKTAAAALLVALLSAAIPAAASPSDTDILAAREAFAKAQAKALEALRPRFAGHPLEAYPAYWHLTLQLERGADAAEVRDFLARYPDSPLAETLRRDWVRALGASGQWDAFRAELPRVAGEDVDIVCYALADRLARGDAEAASEARALFLAGRESHAACEPVFAALATARRIGAEETWVRIRKLLAANHLRDAKRTNAMLPARDAIPEKALDAAGANAVAFLARESPGSSRASREVALYALERLARQKPEEAAQRLEKLAPKLSREDVAYMWGRIAWQAALVHDARALQWYAAAADAPLTDVQVAWKARAAMRAGEWKTVLAAIQALSPEDARESTWRYWRARALKALGEKEASDALLKGLAREQHFYGLLAAEELGVTAVPEWNGWKPEAADLERVRAIPGIQRALILYRVGLNPEGLREWLAAVRGFADRDLLAAAEVARIAGIPDRAINTADRTVQLHDYAQRYPTPHREALAAAARQWSLDEALVYSIIRQESRFMAHARSRVGAMGLMQLMPATARWVARQIPVQPFDVGMLVQPEVNVQMGAYYFRRVLADLGHPVLATAAYNAGPGRARRWRDERALEGAIYAETIPFNETRDYVKKVVANVWFYTHRLSGQAPSLKQLLGTVPGRSAEPPGAVASSIP